MDNEKLLNKIQKAKFKKAPFKHLFIENFLDELTLNKVITSPQINTSIAEESDRKLINFLKQTGYNVIPFPGTFNNEDEYISWRKNTNPNKNDGLCEGIGLTLRLTDEITDELLELKKFFESKEFLKVAEDKFKYNFNDKFYYMDGGIQKYLSGYEISPHPDIRKKFLTWMLNINPMSKSENLNIHTHYLTLIKKFQYLKDFFKFNPDIDRCWVPWEWCETKFIQKENNSLVIFSPSDDTFHAVKSKYSHFEGQRTQLYGNLWYEDSKKIKTTNWSKLDITNIKIDNINHERKNNFK